MNTPNASLAYDGVLDVSIVIPTLFENPLKEDSVTFMADALSLKRRIILMNTTELPGSIPEEVSNDAKALCRWFINWQSR